MAIRNRLHENHTERFKEFLINDGWTIENAKGFYERIRARKGKRLALFYWKHSETHLSYEDKWNGLVSQFLREVKGNA